MFGGNVAGVAVQLHKVGGTQGRRCQEIVKRARGRAIAFVANGLVSNDREVVKLGFKAKFVEKIDFDFHGFYSITVCPTIMQIHLKFAISLVYCFKT